MVSHVNQHIIVYDYGDDKKNDLIIRRGVAIYKISCSCRSSFQEVVKFLYFF